MKYGVADIVHAATSEQENQEIYETMLGAVGQLMAACEASGETRSGANPEDFLVLVGLLWANSTRCSRRSACEKASGTCLPRVGSEGLVTKTRLESDSIPSSMSAKSPMCCPSKIWKNALIDVWRAIFDLHL